MYLTRLELQGFKSFADKTVIEFGKNITSIVGPNGSGKSNIADAIRWVLGEQSIRNLRGSKFEDIIFSGTSTRKRMGFAEVNLILDNTQKMIDIDYLEITVTRRLFRNGNSEYYINMVPCRLKDIHEMFYDTGVGRTGYSVVGQGKIDEILSSRSEDRREVFEEASGITKYKLRKQEAERKLESTEQNLIRIRDIISELEIQLEPLSQQAEKARKYLDFRDELKKSEINLFVHNIKRLMDRTLKLDQSIEETDELIQARKKELNRLTEKEKLRFDATKEIDQKIKTATEEYHGLKNEIERIKADMALLHEKKSNTGDNIRRYTEEISELKNDRAALAADTEKKKERISYLEKQLVKFTEKLEEYEAEYEKLTENLGSEETGIDKTKNMIMDMMDMLSDTRNRANNARSYISSVKKRIHEINTEVVSALSEKDGYVIEKSNTEKTLDKKQNEINHMLSEKSSYENQREQKKQEAVRMDNENIRLLNDINFISSRLRALKDMEENYEGYNKSIKEIMLKAEKDKVFSAGIRGPLAKLIEVAKGHTLPVEIALGYTLQNIVTDGEDAAKRAVAFLKKNDIGRATFLPVSSIKGYSIPGNIRAVLEKKEGFLAIASDTVKCEAGYRNIVENFLGGTIIVSDLDAAVRISNELKNEYRVVTSDGDMINRGGAITGGSIKGASSNLLMRGEEIEELGVRIQLSKKEYEQKRIAAEKLKAEIKELDDAVSKADYEINAARISYVKLQAVLKQLTETIDRISSRAGMLNGEKTQLEKDHSNSEKEASELEAEFVRLDKEIKALKDNVERRSGLQKERQSERDILNTEITDHKISVNSVNESIRNLKDSLTDLENKITGIETEIGKTEESIEKGKRLLQQSEEMDGKYTTELANTEQRIIGKETLMERLEQEKDDLEASIKTAYEDKERIESDIEKIKEERSRIEIRKVKCEAETDTIKNRLWDEYELTFGNCEKTSAPVDNAQRIQNEIESLRNSIRELGDVNVNAINDYIKTKERHGFLKTQHADMIKAGEDLNRVIKEMEAIMKKQFLEQFRKINELFNQVFRDLFIGGSASIELVDETNILDSAIEINVQPPGKKLQNMMLLSGGERAFTAIALLFAIIKLKDTPFCVLDEIDSALDDPNVIRFSDYIRELTRKTQFILVTHRKGTMEASDVLYGVTSEEKGVSKIVSLNMNS